MPYFRVSLQGTLPGGEKWSVNPQFMVGGDGISTTWDQAAGQSTADAIAALSPGAALRSAAGAGAPLARVRLEMRTDQHELIGAAEANYSGTAFTGGMTKPVQTSVVLSLRSNVPGRSARGRLYWPGLGDIGLGGDGRIGTTLAQSMATQAAAYLRSIQDAIKNGIFPATLLTVELGVVSSTVALLQTKVVRVEVGNVPDVQRRRRDRLPEVYSSAPLYP